MCGIYYTPPGTQCPANSMFSSGAINVIRSFIGAHDIILTLPFMPHSRQPRAVADPLESYGSVQCHRSLSI